MEAKSAFLNYLYGRRFNKLFLYLLCPLSFASFSICSHIAPNIEIRQNIFFSLKNVQICVQKILKDFGKFGYQTIIA
ncbi:hypothetical protein BpHYR1_007044 [Brachionus plicatilis]|uniref:Uncharacterized protein n=1 Tax=Brachionus plicatilis TaxID=10195 RepID=A0A3M7SKU7_BRAPC|nr:hypothetical protein BpHYR1_007044 [Brachionus plicatilis]